MCTQKMRALSYIGAEKITFPPKPDIQTDIQKDRRTDICFYRVAFATKNVVTDGQTDMHKSQRILNYDNFSTVNQKVEYKALLKFSVCPTLSIFKCDCK